MLRATPGVSANTAQVITTPLTTCDDVLISNSISKPPFRVLISPNRTSFRKLHIGKAGWLASTLGAFVVCAALHATPILSRSCVDEPGSAQLIEWFISPRP